MPYKKYMFLLVYISFVIHIIDVSSESINFFHFNDSDTTYDVTTIYKITNSSLNIDNGGFKDKHFLHKFNGSYSIKIRSRTNALGLPIDKELNRNFPSNNILQANIPMFFKNGLSQNTSRMQVLYDPIDWVDNCIGLTGNSCCRIHNATDHHEDKCYNFLEYRYDRKHRTVHDLQSLKIFSIVWTPEKDQTCLAITYALLPSSKIGITMNVFGENNTLISSKIFQKFNGTTTLKVMGMNLRKDTKYELSFQVSVDMSYYNYNVGRSYGRSMGYCGFWFGILRIADCSNYEEEVRTVFLNGQKKHQRPESFGVIGNSTSYKKSASKILCLNGGYKKSKNDTCVCPPGFTGSECEIGCGPNSYGADCKGVCSKHDGKMCRGLYMCTRYGCICPPGLTGPLCNKDCEIGKYGSDCKQTCTQCVNESCDPYTGACSQGCSPGYIQPNCSYKYPYLAKPPKLVSNNYDKIKIKMNFQPSNVKGGNKSIKLKYYRIFYKESRKKIFMNSETKPIVEKKYRPNVVLNDLKPDTEYMIGVLLITDDGNFNDQDIVYGRFKTSCIDPKISDYRIRTVKAVQSIKLKWNKVNSSRLECKIVEKFVRLTFDQSLNKTVITRKLKVKSRNAFNVKNLEPGYQYGLELILKTSQGNLISSSVYSASPFIGDAIKIKQVNTVFENGKIKISWKYGLKHNHFSTIEPDIDEPITTSLRYKIEKILSCSLEELSNNWTTITIFNQTNYEIPNTVPNTQYHVQLYISKNDSIITQSETPVFALTPATNPEIAPVFDEQHPIVVTNNSVFFHWELDLLNCPKLNGFFSKFYIELKNKSDGTLITRETKKQNILIDYLKSNTSYELKVFVKTHIGYNPEHYLFTNFTTKIRMLMPIEDLMVYNKSIENSMVGLCWSYLENRDLVGFIVSFDDDRTKLQNVTIIPPTKCSTWPNYYCHTFNNLSVSGNYTFKVKPKTLDYPDGMNASTILFNISDALFPDSPRTMKVIDVGNTTVTIEWDTPWVFNGILTHFVVSIEEIAALDEKTCCAKIPPVNVPFNVEVSSYNYTIKELKPGTTYSVDTFSVSKSLHRSFPATTRVTTLKDGF